MIQRVAILGAGAVGGYFVWGLSEKLGKNLWVIAKGERKERLEREGLTINGEIFHFPVKTPEEAAGADLLLVATKYGALEESLEDIAAVVGKNTIVLSLLNGVDSEEIIGERIGREHMLYSIMKIASERRGREILFNGETTPGLFYGEPGASVPTERCLEVAQVLEGTPLHYHISPDIERDIWYKFALNVSQNAALWTLRTVLIDALKLLHPYMPFIIEEIFCTLQSEEESIMISRWPVYTEERSFSGEEKAIETIKEAVRGIRNIRTEMNVAPSRKASVYVVSGDEEILNTFTEGKLFFASLAYANEVFMQKDKSGIAQDAVSVVIPGATLYIPFAELVDIAQEIERLEKEQKRLEGELNRVNGMLSNERFISKAPEAKIAEEKEKLAKYTAMMEQVKSRLAQLQK